LYDSLAGDNRETNRVWPVRPTRGVNRGYQSGVLKPDGSLANFTSVSAPTVYRGDRLPAELRGNVFVVEPAGNLVARIVLEDDGTTLRARKAYEGAEFLASTDERFRPVNLSSAPDGTLYILDMYRGIIQHKGYITEYLRDQILSRKLEAPIGRGRIYRVVHETTSRGPRPRLTGTRSSDLLPLLSHANGWWRDTAQRLIVERQDTSVVPALGKLAASAPDWRTRLHALWTLDGIGAITNAEVVRALSDARPEVRLSAVRLAERFLPTSPVVAAALLARSDDPHWAVRRQLAATYGEFSATTKLAPLAGMLERHGDDPIVVDAAISGLRGQESVMLARLLGTTTETSARTTAVTMLAATVVRSADDGRVRELFAWAAETSRPEWQRAALVRGAEVALLNAPMPAPSVARAGGPPANPPPCPTCPGARGGPGGAPAFPNPQPAPAGGGAGRPRGPALRLGQEPALTKILPTDPLSKRAASLLATIEWPGKPGAAAPVTPLTSAETALFNEGREIYASVCAACHQADGRGRLGVAPTLIGSEFALGPAEVAARIVIGGKEGSTGLMPPLGATLADDKVAAALTYIRREWGQDGSPVDTSAVAAARKSSAGRTRPWTAEELGGILRTLSEGSR
jgi:mono/diheme cytochrome c family protein